MARTVDEGSYAAPVDAPLRADLGGTSWGAIVGGAVVATAVSLVLMLLGSGLGMTVVSPWDYAGVTATTFAVSTAIWLIVTQWISAGIGGYIAGRLRARWTNIPADEVFFRDTAHGFIAWALATLIVATVLASTMAAITGTATQAAATVAAGGTAAAVQAADETAPGGLLATDRARDRTGQDETAYMVDRLFRVPAPPGVGAPTTAADARAETQRILATGLDAPIADDDRAYLVQLVANRAGVSPADAQSRVDAAIERMKTAKREAQAAADAARKAAATIAIVGALSLVIGAFIASVGGALGGRLRDDPTR